MTDLTLNEKKSNGTAAAAMIAGGIGTLMIGLLTTGSVIISGLKDLLNFWSPAGSLTGKTSIGILVWLISWVILNSLWKDRDYDIGKALTITLALVGIGLLLTFPPIFEAFE
jgi:hypothetical protein